MPLTRTLALLSLACCASSAANASGPAFTRLFAVADNAQTAFLSPAGMTRLDESQFVVQAIVAQGFGDFEVDESLTTEKDSPYSVALDFTYSFR